MTLVRMDDPEMGPGTEVEVTGTDGKSYSAQWNAPIRTRRLSRERL